MNELVRVQVNENQEQVGTREVRDTDVEKDDAIPISLFTLKPTQNAI